MAVKEAEEDEDVTEENAEIENMVWNIISKGWSSKSCVLKAFAVKGWLIPSVDTPWTLQFALDRHSMDISLISRESRLSIDASELFNTWLTID